MATDGEHANGFRTKSSHSVLNNKKRAFVMKFLIISLKTYDYRNMTCDKELAT